MNENVLGKKISLLASQLGHRIFRNNVGLGWVGKSIRFSKEIKITVYPGDVLVKQARPLHAGLIEGSGDFIGFSKDGKFISLELKTEIGKIRPEQITFIDAVNRSGGIAGIVRTEEEGFELLS